MRRELRRAAGLTVRDVADYHRVSGPTASRWESGKRHPGGQHLWRYAAFLDVLAETQTASPEEP